MNTHTEILTKSLPFTLNKSSGTEPMKDLLHFLCNDEANTPTVDIFEAYLSWLALVTEAKPTAIDVNIPAGATSVLALLKHFADNLYNELLESQKKTTRNPERAAFIKKVLPKVGSLMAKHITRESEQSRNKHKIILTTIIAEMFTTPEIGEHARAFVAALNTKTAEKEFNPRQLLDQWIIMAISCKQSVRSDLLPAADARFRYLRRTELSASEIFLLQNPLHELCERIMRSHAGGDSPTRRSLTEWKLQTLAKLQTIIDLLQTKQDKGPRPTNIYHITDTDLHVF